VGVAINCGKFDGLYLGRCQNGALIYAGKVENGFDAAVEQRLRACTEKLKTKVQPLTKKIKKPKATWLKPKLMVDVEYRALTGTGQSHAIDFDELADWRIAPPRDKLDRDVRQHKGCEQQNQQKFNAYIGHISIHLRVSELGSVRLDPSTSAAAANLKCGDS